MTVTKKERLGLSSTRVETLVDGIFAIVMTLLVLELRVPELMFRSDRELVHKLLQLWPNLAAYALSFLVLAVFWFSHHVQYYYIVAVNRVLVWLNILFVLFVALIPFSAALVGRYGYLPSAVTIYAANIVLAALTDWWHWRYATSKRRLVDENMELELIRMGSRRLLGAVVVYAAAIPVAWMFPRFSILIFVIVPIAFLIPERIDKYWRVDPNEYPSRYHAKR